MASVLGTTRHVRCNRSKPPPPTADAACIAINDATQDRYLCKDQTKEPWLPLMEWLAQHLARLCGVLVPDCYVIELEANPGTYMFGSKWEGGAEQYATDLIRKITNPAEFSSIHVFDLLIHNIDRHLNNYLYLQLAGDTIVKAVDHSRCLWISGWPIPAPPPSAETNTMRARRNWEREVQWNSVAAATVLENWRRVTTIEVEEIISSAPQKWIDPAKREELLTWWGSAMWETRNQQIGGLI